MKRRLPRIGLLSLLALPAMFALGWWARGLNYNRDVYVAAAKIAEDSGGFFIPELGVVHGRKRLSDRYNAMSPAAKAEMDRRLAYYTEMIEPTFDPPKPGIVESAISLFSSVTNTLLSPDSATENGDSSISDTADAERRIKLFRELRDRSPPSGFGSTTHQEEIAEPE